MSAAATRLSDTDAGKILNFGEQIKAVAGPRFEHPKPLTFATNVIHYMRYA